MHLSVDARGARVTPVLRLSLALISTLNPREARDKLQGTYGGVGIYGNVTNAFKKGERLNGREGRARR